MGKRSKKRKKKNIPVIVSLDTTSVRMQELVRKEKDFTDSYRIESNKIIESIKCVVKIFQPTGKNASKILERYQSQIDYILEKTFSDNTKYFWLHLESRIFPELPYWYKRNRTSGNNVYESRHRLRLAILKYGAYKSKYEEFELKNNEYVPKKLTIEHVKRIYSAEELCHVFTWINVLIRHLNKTPSRLVIHPVEEISVLHSKETWELIERFDLRLEKENNILSRMGGISNRSYIKDLKEIQGNAIILFRANADRSFKIEQPSPLLPFEPNYLLYFLRNNFYKRVISNCAMQEKFEKVYDFNFEKFIFVFSAISSLTIKNMLANIRFFYQVLQRGYLIQTSQKYEEFISNTSLEFKELYKNFLDKDISLSESIGIVKKVLHSNLWTKADFTEISLKILTPHKTIVNTGYGYLIDLRMVEQVINEYLVLMGSYSDKSGTIKGDLFEKDVRNLLRKGGNILWRDADERRGMNILKDNRGNVVGDVDCAVIKGKTLFICDCKAMYRSAELIDGDIDELIKRKKQINKYLKRQNELVEFIIKNREKLRVPKEVTNFENVLITPFPEYIHSFKKKYWLGENCPRVLTPSEFESFLAGFN